MKAQKSLFPAAAFGLLALARSAGFAYDQIKPLSLIENKEAMNRPVAVAAADSRIFVLDSKKGLLIFDREGKLLKSLPDFSDSESIAVGPDGRLYLADSRSHSIRILSPEGKVLGGFGKKGSSLGELKSPSGVAVDPDGRVFVSDTKNNRLQAFTEDGIFLFSFGSIQKPARIRADRSGFIYVLDEKNKRIEKFDGEGVLVKSLPVFGESFAVDDYGFLYVLDSREGKIAEFAADGARQGAPFGASGKKPGQFSRPENLFMDSEGVLYVADTRNSRVQRMLVENKQKSQPLPLNQNTRIFLSGPVSSFSHALEALAPAGEGSIWGYNPDSSELVLLDSKGAVALKTGGKGKEPGKLRGAGAVAYSHTLGLYVADTDNHRVQQFAADGKFVRAFGEAQGFFESRSKEGNLDSPRGVALSEGTVYVADTGNSRIQTFSPEGRFISAFGPRLGSFNLSRPVSVAYHPQGFLYILDSKLKRVFRCEPSGKLIDSWAGKKDENFTEPSALALDDKGYVYVLDSGAGRVHIFSPEGKWMGSFFSVGQFPSGQLAALAPQSNTLALSHIKEGKILLYQVKVKVIPPSSVAGSYSEGTARLSWEAPKDPWASLYSVEKSTLAEGHYREVAVSSGPNLTDKEVEPFTTYYYRVATLSHTRDAGPFSRPVSVYVPGSRTKPPLEILDISLQDIFSSNYKYYNTHPMGKLTLTNTTNITFESVKLSFTLKDFMDFATETTLKAVAPRAVIEAPLQATLNNRILDVSEDTPIQAEFKLTYYLEGEQKTVSLTKPLKVFSRNAIIWDKTEKIATFITPKDPPVVDFSREVLFRVQKFAQEELPVNSNLLTAFHFWNAFNALGISYISNPSNPSVDFAKDPKVVDYSQFPQETLKRKSGQCDELVVLMSTLLEGVGIETRLVDYPGHIALMLDTGALDPLEAGIPAEKMIQEKGRYWVPLEMTLMGSSFEEAWSRARHTYEKMKEKDNVQLVDVRGAWKEYEPVTLPATQWEAPLPEEEKMAKLYRAQAPALVKDRYEFLKKHYQGQLEGDSKNFQARIQLGVLEAESKNLEQARKEFETVLSYLPEDAAALNNLGNLSYLKEDYAGAESYYSRAGQADPEDSGIWMNLARTAMKQNQKDLAQEYAGKALELDKGLEPEVNSLLKGGL